MPLGRNSHRDKGLAQWIEPLLEQIIAARTEWLRNRADMILLTEWGHQETCERQERLRNLSPAERTELSATGPIEVPISQQIRDLHAQCQKRLRALNVAKESLSIALSALDGGSRLVKYLEVATMDREPERFGNVVCSIRALVLTARGAKRVFPKGNKAHGRQGRGLKDMTDTQQLREHVNQIDRNWRAGHDGRVNNRSLCQTLDGRGVRLPSGQRWNGANTWRDALKQSGRSVMRWLSEACVDRRNGTGA